MIDSTKLSQDWGYGTQAGVSPTQQQTSITKQPTTTAAGASPWSNMMGQLSTPTPTLTPISSGATSGTINYPSDWAGLSDFYRNFMEGGYTNPALTEGLDWTRMMAQTGNPVDVTGWADAYRPAMMDEYSNMVKQMAEQAGVAGTRYGSGLQQAIGNYGGQLQNQFNRDMMDRWLQSQEAARGRQMTAGGNYLPYGQLGLAAQQYGGEGLLGLGGAKENYYNQAMNNLLGGGQYMNEMMIDPAQHLMASLVGLPGQTQQTWQPSRFEDVMGGLSFLPWGSMFGGGFDPTAGDTSIYDIMKV